MTRARSFARSGRLHFEGDSDGDVLGPLCTQRHDALQALAERGVKCGDDAFVLLALGVFALRPECGQPRVHESDQHRGTFASAIDMAVSRSGRNAATAAKCWSA